MNYLQQNLQKLSKQVKIGLLLFIVALCIIIGVLAFRSTRANLGIPNQEVNGYTFSEIRVTHGKESTQISAKVTNNLESRKSNIIEIQLLDNQTNIIDTIMVYMGEELNQNETISIEGTVDALYDQLSSIKFAFLN